MDNGSKNTLAACCAVHLTVASTCIATFSFSSLLGSNVFAVKQRLENRSTTRESSRGEGLHVRYMLCTEIQESNIPQSLIQSQ